MDFINLPKGLFTLRKAEADVKEDHPVPEPEREGILNANSLLHNENTTVERSGFNSARAHNGSTIGLSICLNRLYMDFRNKMVDDTAKQEELKRPHRLKLHELKAENEGNLKRVEKIKSEEIPNCNSKIEILRKNITDIKSNPEIYTGDKSGRASFYIGLAILAFLTIYLFVFYSSASYSSFFKEFTLSEIGIANTIFDAQALSRAYNDGFTELILIVTIPAVFLGLGYLIHKSSEKKGVKKFLFVASLIFITFIFDTIIAYEICEKIYNIKKSNSFQAIPDYTIKLAFQSINFWLIIFAGFVVYLIWGLVFDFTIDAHEKLDKVRLAIKHKEDEIKSVEDNIHKLNLETKELEEKASKNMGEINKLNELVEGTRFIEEGEFKQYLYHFMQGWLQWMAANLKNQTQQQECEKVLILFIETNIRQIQTINS